MTPCRVANCLSSSRATLEKVVVNVAYSYANKRKGNESQAQRAAVQHRATTTGENRKMAGSSLYLNELPG